jgi:PBP1b-binding outer membrane lipoprotein LpoB
MKKSLPSHLITLILIIILAGCGNPAATPEATETQAEVEVEATSTDTAVSTVEPTETSDPCSMPQLEKEVQEVHNHMREFDDAAALASSLTRDQLSSAVAELQRIRREAEDEQIPGCLTNLRKIQVDHMNTVISTLLAFMKGNVDDQTIQQAIGLARQQHDQYLLEYARVVGLTVVPATLPPAPSATPTP